MKPSKLPPGPWLRTASALTPIALVAVMLGCVWGLDWRWIPTAALAALAVLVVANALDGRRDRRLGRQ